MNLGLQHSVVHFIMLLTYASSLEEYKFGQGCNASVTFPWKLTGSSVVFELFATQRSRPFYVNGQVDPTALRPDQRDRFHVDVNQLGVNLTVKLEIDDIQIDDADVYILALREIVSGKSIDHILDAYISVTLPPGDAICNISLSPYSSDWRVIRCQATAESATVGDIVCFQNSEPGALRGEKTFSQGILYGVYWVLKNASITCCSGETDKVILPAKCNHYVISSPNNPDVSISRSKERAVTVTAPSQYTEQSVLPSKNTNLESDQYSFQDATYIYIIYCCSIVLCVALLISLVYCIWFNVKCYHISKQSISLLKNYQYTPVLNGHTVQTDSI